MTKLSQSQPFSKAGRGAAFGLALALAFVSTLATARAETRVFGCDFVKRHSQAEALAAFSYARQKVGSAQASNLYGAYVGLKNECQSNPEATRAVNLSPAVVAVIGGD